jgi:hypothetical protein
VPPVNKKNCFSIAPSPDRSGSFLGPRRPCAGSFGLGLAHFCDILRGTDFPCRAAISCARRSRRHASLDVTADMCPQLLPPSPGSPVFPRSTSAVLLDPAASSPQTSLLHRYSPCDAGAERARQRLALGHELPSASSLLEFSS